MYSTSILETSASEAVLDSQRVSRRTEKSEEKEEGTLSRIGSCLLRRIHERAVWATMALALDQIRKGEWKEAQVPIRLLGDTLADTIDDRLAALLSLQTRLLPF